MKDVICKLPGIDVSDAGAISYNGKNISNFYVEGMDLADGRYNQIANNLQAKAVETVQILENHQPIRALQHQIKTENVALNLKLKPAFCDRWMAYLQGGSGARPLLWTSAAHAMQLSRQSQSSYTFKTNNTGEDVTDEQMILFEREWGRICEQPLPAFLSQPTIAAPLKKERLLFNNVQALSVNRLYKSGETSQLRLHSNYTHDVRRQERGSETAYFQSSDTLLVAEQSHTRMSSDEADLTLRLENNAESHFLTNRFNALGRWDRSTSLFSGSQSVDQQMKTSNLGLRNDFKDVRNLDAYTLEIRSLLRYNHLPASLTINDTVFPLHMNHFYSDQSLALISKKGALSHQYTVGTTGEANTILNSYALYAIPTWQWNPYQWSVDVSLPVVWTKFPSMDYARAMVNPSVGLQYKLNYAWRFSASGSFRESYGHAVDFYNVPFRTDYRRITDNGQANNLPVFRQQTYSVYGEYRHTVNEFFASISLNQKHLHSNRIYEQRFDGNQMTLKAVDQLNYSSGQTIKGVLSKGFYDWGMNALLNYSFGRTRGEQLNGGIRMPYVFRFMQYEPKITWTPLRWIEVGYQSTLHCGSSTIGIDTRLTPLWRIVQDVHVAYEFFPGVDWTVSAQHYYNKIGISQFVSTFFVDLALRWKPGDWQVDASLTNLFDKRQYGYTEYSSFQRYTSWVHIRGRAFLLSAKYRF